MIPYIDDPQLRSYLLSVEERLGRIGRHSSVDGTHLITGVAGTALRQAPLDHLTYWSSWTGDGGTYANGTNAFVWGSPNSQPPSTNDLTTADNTNFTSRWGGLYWVSAVGAFGATNVDSDWTLPTQENPGIVFSEVFFNLVITLGAGGSSTINGTLCEPGFIGSNGLNPIADPDILGSGAGYYVLNPYSYPVGDSGPSYFALNALPPGSTQVNTLIYLNPGDAFKINLVNSGSGTGTIAGYGNSLVLLRLADRK